MMERKFANREISCVQMNSYAWQAGVRPGDVLLTVNRQSFNDLIDLSFLFAEEEVELEILTLVGDRKLVRIKNLLTMI